MEVRKNIGGGSGTIGSSSVIMYDVPLAITTKTANFHQENSVIILCICKGAHDEERGGGNKPKMAF